jgi:predicted amino acid dehydrogenase
VAAAVAVVDAAGVVVAAVAEVLAAATCVRVCLDCAVRERSGDWNERLTIAV